MATQLGELQLDSIDGPTLKGWFRSVYEENVRGANTYFAANYLKDAWEHSGNPEGALADLLDAEGTKGVENVIEDVSFETPNTKSTIFSITVSDPDLLEGLKCIYWESYLLG